MNKKDERGSGVEILYADNWLTVCVKPAGVRSEDELPALLEQETGKKHFCVHRLDQAVGGLMVLARDGKTAAKLSDAFAARETVKQYLAVCPDTLESDSGEMNDLLFHDSARNKTFVVSRMRKGVREASLGYQVLRRKDGMALVAVTLHTGRSHQIRAQFAARKAPLAGDGKYGSTVKGCGIALWSCRLCFRHPTKNTPMDFTLPPPETYPWNTLREV